VSRVLFKMRRAQSAYNRVHGCCGESGQVSRLPRGGSVAGKMTPSVHPKKTSPQRRTRFVGSDRRNVLQCIVLFLLTVAATMPVYEMGFEDDWSYSHIAREFASTGHIVYNGWTAAMLLPQIFWSALFIKVFGFSFLIMRLSTITLVVALVPVLYYLFLESGLDASFAVFGTLLTVLSPLVLPMTATFLSDVPAFFLFALCFYCGVKSWKAHTTKACVVWGCLIALAGAVSGLDRQIYWLAPLLFLPVVAWIRRRTRGAAIGLGLAWLFTLMVVAYFAKWFASKPFTLTEHTLHQWRTGPIRELLGNSFSTVIDLGLTAGLILLPALVAFVRLSLGAIPRMRIVLLVAGVVAVTVAVAPDHTLPAMGNIFTEFGIQTTWPMGTPPTWTRLAVIGIPYVVLGPAVRQLLTAATLLCVACCVIAIWKRRNASWWNSPAAPALVLGIVFAAVWLPALLIRSVGTPAYDRYLIAFLPLASIPLLRFCQAHSGGRVSRWSWGLLTLFAVYGVATAHDAFARGRARLTAAQALAKAGIPRTEIMAGFEYDGWTQLDTAGYVNNWQMEKPAGVFHQVKCTAPPQAIQQWYLYLMPTIRPRYFVVISRKPGLVDGPTAPIGYTTWLPPARRQVFTQELPGGGSGGCR